MAIATDKNGADIGIGTFVYVDNTKIEYYGKVMEVTYTQNGDCMVKVAGNTNRVNNRYVEVAEFTEVEQIIYQAFLDYKVKLKPAELADMVSRLGEAFDKEENNG